VGAGYSQRNEWLQKSEMVAPVMDDSMIAPGSGIDSAMLADALLRTHIVLQKEKAIFLQSYGPEFGLMLNLRASTWGMARADMRMRIPVETLLKLHAIRPDYDIYTTVSWLLTRSVTIDYLFQYVLKQPLDNAKRDEVSTHSIFLRFSFNSQ